MKKNKNNGETSNKKKPLINPQCTKKFKGPFLESPGNFFWPVKLFYVCSICSKDLQFIILESNTIKVTVNKTKGTRL